MAYQPTIPVTLTDELDNPVGVPLNPIWVNAVLVATSNLSIGPNGAPVPLDSTQVGGPDNLGILHASQVLNSDPLGAEYGTVTRDVGLALGTAKALVAGTGVAGVPAAGVVTVQGIAGGTAIPVSGTFSSASVGLTGAAIPGSADQIGGPDAGGLLRAPRVLPADPIAGDFGLVTRDVGLALGTAKALVAGTGVAGAPAAGVVTIQGIAGGTVVPISAAALPLPAGAATEATLAGVLTTAAFQARINTLGQNTMANSTPVVIASDQSVLTTAGNLTNNNAAPGATHVGSLGAIASAATQAWTDGREVLLSVYNSGEQRIGGGQTGTATLSNVASSAANVTLLSANTSRKGVMVVNDGNKTLLLKYGATASATSYTVPIYAGGYWEMPWPIYTGIIDGIWTAANGSARITEL